MSESDENIDVAVDAFIRALDGYLRLTGFPPPDGARTLQLDLTDSYTGSVLDLVQRWKVTAAQLRTLADVFVDLTQPPPPPDAAAIVMTLLAKRRRHLGLNLEQMAGKLMLSPGALSNLEKLGTAPTLAQMLAYMKVLETTYQNLRNRVIGEQGPVS